MDEAWLGGESKLEGDHVGISSHASVPPPGRRDAEVLKTEWVEASFCTSPRPSKTLRDELIERPEDSIQRHEFLGLAKRPPASAG